MDYEPFTFAGSDADGKKAHAHKVKRTQGEEAIPKALRGDIAVANFCRQGWTCMFDVRMSNTNSASYCKRDTLKVLDGQEKSKKKKHDHHCKNR